MTPRFAVVELVTADMAASLAFYRRLGIDIPDDADGQPHVDASLSGGLRISWDTHDTIRSFSPDWTPPSPGEGAISLGFECDAPDDVDETYAELVDAGYEGHMEPWDAVWGMRYAVVGDPDGNGVDLFARLPETSDDAE